MWYIFTESSSGKLGLVGSRFSEAAAADLESNYEMESKTHRVEADNEEEAKQHLRGKLVREKGPDWGHKNVINKEEGV
jgi:hypothetical protein